MKTEKNEDGKSWTELFGIKGEREKQSENLKVNYPGLTNEDLNYENDTYEAENETGLFI